jgi:hypothetical protein
MRTLPVLHRLACAAIAALMAGSAPAVRAAERAGASLNHPIVFTQLPAGWAEAKERGLGEAAPRPSYGEGARIVRLDPDGQLRVLTEGFASAAEPDISFDGTHILFAGKRQPVDIWSIWEMNAAGGDARQITKDLGNCRSPVYLSLMYSIGAHGSAPAPPGPWQQIMFVSDAAGAANETGSDVAAHLYSCKLDGSLVRRLTYNLSSDLDPFLMDDGRVLLAGWQRRDLRRGFGGRVALFGMNTDGTDYALFCGDQGRRIKRMPCVTTNGLAVFVEANQLAWDGAGQLGAATLRRNFHSYRALTDDPAVMYHSPAPLLDGAILVSCRAAAERRAPAEAGGSGPASGAVSSGPTTRPVADDGPMGGTHGIYRFDPKTGRRRLLFDDPQRHDLGAKALTPRRQPDGRSSSVNEEYRTGKLYCLNAYLAEPRYLGQLGPNNVRAVRVLEGVPPANFLERRKPGEPDFGWPGVTGHGLPAVAPRRVLGQAPVEDDGSFHLEVPADIPIELQLLDADGVAIRSCGWIWARPREARGCIGCHEDPELAPENRFVKAVQKPAVQLTLPPEKRRTVDFRRDVMPILARKCASCHTGQDGSLDLRAEPTMYFNRAYETLLTPAEAEDAAPEPPASAGALLGKYVVPCAARTSPLVWWLMGRNGARPWDAAPARAATILKHPSENVEPLSEDERQVVIEWIDLGAPWGSIPRRGDAGRAASADAPPRSSGHADSGPKEGATP